MPDTGIDQGQGGGVPTNPLPVDLPKETVALPHPAGTALAPLLLPLPFHLAKQAILVSELEEVFRSEKVHNLAILLQRDGKNKNHKTSASLR
jgi:hypothetical protein